MLTREEAECLIKQHHEDCANDLLLLFCTQLFSSEETQASQQHKVTVYGAPGPEPFTAFPVTEQTTAKQLLDMVSALERKAFYSFDPMDGGLSWKLSLPHRS